MRQAALALASGLVFGVMTVSPSLVNGQESSPGGSECPQPYDPVYVQRIGVSGGPPHDPPPAIQLSEVPFRLGVRGDDFDGDGTSDVTYNGDHTEARVGHPNGEYVFTFDGEHVLAYSGGDLNGNGGPEILITTSGADSYTGTYIVPSSTAPGTYEPGDVGIRVETGAPGVLDVLGDSQLEITIFIDDTTDVFSSAEIFAVGAPGDARGVEPSASYAGGIGLVDFGDGRGDVVIGQRTAFSAPEAISVYERGDVNPFATFTTGENHAGPFVRAWIGDGGRYLTLENAQRNQVSETFYWSIDNPCTELRAASLPETPPAEPVVGNPTFTG